MRNLFHTASKQQLKKMQCYTVTIYIFHWNIDEDSVLSYVQSTVNSQQSTVNSQW